MSEGRKRMTYVISGINGYYDKLTELLTAVRFSDEDILYVLGDMVGTGSGSVETLNDLSMRANVYPIAGDQDFRTLRMLSGFDRMAKDGSTPDAAFISEMTDWATKDGGQEMLTAFRALDEDAREGVLDYLSEMTLFEEVTVGGKRYVLVHAGIRGFDPDRALDDYEPDDFMTEIPDFAEPYSDDFTTVVGHTPTSAIPGATAGCIFRTEGCIAVDCGVTAGGRLACLRLEDGAEFYA